LRLPSGETESDEWKTKIVTHKGSENLKTRILYEGNGERTILSRSTRRQANNFRIELHVKRKKKSRTNNAERMKRKTSTKEKRKREHRINKKKGTIQEEGGPTRLSSTSDENRYTKLLWAIKEERTLRKKENPSAAKTDATPQLLLPGDGVEKDFQKSTSHDKD